jgi:lipid A 4'-phosphatase
VKLRGNRIWRCLADLALPLLLAVAISIWLSSGERDLRWQRALFVAETGNWSRGDARIWRLLYDFGTLPALLVCGAGVVALVAGLRWGWWRRWRRVAWYFLALFALGSGIVTNLWLKDTWGRPRPRDVVEFGGRSPYEGVFAMDLVGEGKSFPSGHATAGFLFVGLWFLLRGRRPGLAAIALGAALVWGSVIGYARMLQGGHFATDVVWAAAVMWMAAAALHYAFGLDRSVLDLPRPGRGDRRKIPMWAKLAGGLGLATLVGVVSLATPYRDLRMFRPFEPAADVSRIRGSISILLGDVTILSEPVLRIEGQASGHGVPTSEIADHWDEAVEPNGRWRFEYQQRASGYLTEVRQDLEIGIPWERVDRLKFDLGPGKVRLRLPAVKSPIGLELVIRDTDLLIELEPGARMWLNPEKTTAILGGAVGAIHEGESPPEEPSYRISVTSREGGGIAIERAGTDRD